MLILNEYYYRVHKITNRSFILDFIHWGIGNPDDIERSVELMLTIGIDWLEDVGDSYWTPLLNNWFWLRIRFRYDTIRLRKNVPNHYYKILFNWIIIIILIKHCELTNKVLAVHNNYTGFGHDTILLLLLLLFGLDI